MKNVGEPLYYEPITDRRWYVIIRPYLAQTPRYISGPWTLQGSADLMYAWSRAGYQTTCSPATD